MNSSLPKHKLAYRFTCFISQGDQDGDVLPDESDNDPVVISKVPDELRPELPNGSHDSKVLIADEAKENPGETLERATRQLNEAARQQLEEAEESRVRLEAAKVEEERLAVEGFRPLDGDDPCVYSTKVGVAPYSFVTTDPRFIPSCPPPTYLNDQELVSWTRIKKHELLKGLEIPPEGGLLCTDKEALKRQSGIVSNMLAQLITTLSISRISLPVRIFEPRSMLERIVDLWRFAPFYLQNAAKTKDKLDRFKQVIAFAVAGLYTTMQQLKPFNPIIGETLEGTFSDGTQIYLEHTSHHPPISNFLMTGPDDAYKMYGHHEYKGHVSANTLEGQQDGPNTVEFANGQKITFHYPKVKIHGIIMGSRMIYQSGPMTFEDTKNRIKAVIIFNYGKSRSMFSSRKKGTKIDDFDGLIYYARKMDKPQEMVAQIKDLKDVEMPIGPITGSWLRSLKIAGATYWDIDKLEPAPVLFAPRPLPSDWRYREDLIWLRRQNMDRAQEWKVRLEVEQRRDRTLREKMAKK